MNTLKLSLVAAAALGSAVLAAGTASAMPLGGLATASTEAAAKIQDVRWVCGPFRCWWRPNYAVVAPYPVYRYRQWWGPRRDYAYRWGWRRWY